ncbi:hypothetical protein ES703_42819 [subsurface metagenome]
MMDMTMDSLKNCFISWLLCEPKTFLIPTSLARLADLAVERFIKLKHAINKTKSAIAENK